MSDVGADAPVVPLGLQLAPLSRRMLGLAIDQVVVFLPVVAGALVAGYRPGDDITDDGMLAFNVALAAITLVYETLMIALLGRTVGKLAVRTRVVSSVDGGRIGWSSAFLRALLPTAVGVVPGVGLMLGSFVYLWAFFTPLRQGLHDRAAGTIVVLERRAPMFRRGPGRGHLDV